MNEALNPNIVDTDEAPSFRVLKFGRTTRWTAGVVNELGTDCMRDGLVSTEMCVLDFAKALYGDIFPEFSVKGDSGAPVIDYHGRLVGIFHGGQTTGKPFSYVTPIEWLFESISEATGMRVELNR